MSEAKIRIKDEELVLGFSDALYDAECGECGYGLEWRADFDADGTTYNAHCCSFDYFMVENTVTVSREKGDDYAND